MDYSVLLCQNCRWQVLNIIMISNDRTIASRLWHGTIVSDDHTTANWLQKILSMYEEINNLNSEDHTNSFWLRHNTTHFMNMPSLKIQWSQEIIQCHLWWTFEWSKIIHPMGCIWLCSRVFHCWSTVAYYTFNIIRVASEILKKKQTWITVGIWFQLDWVNGTFRPTCQPIQIKGATMKSLPMNVQTPERWLWPSMKAACDTIVPIHQHFDHSSICGKQSATPIISYIEAMTF